VSIDSSAVRTPSEIPTHLSLSLVALSVAIAILASYSALDLARRSSEARGWHKRLWLGGGGLTMGVGIWSMHFVGMLSLRMPIPVSYDDGLVVLSLVVAVAGAGVSLAVVTRPQVSTRGVLSAAAFMGLAIASMHYLGMASMRMAATIHWQITLVLLSLAVAFLASLFALWLIVAISTSSNGFGVVRRLAASVLLGIGAAGLHYTAMTAASFTAVIRRTALHGGLSTSSLVLMLAVGAGIMLAVLIGGAAVDQRRAALASELTLGANLARELCRGGDTRGRICQAIRELTSADYVLLAEPDDRGGRQLTSSIGVALGSDAWNLAEKPAPVATVLHEPLALDDQQVGVLTIGWHHRIRPLPDRTRMLMSMFAAEGAVAINREHLLSQLEYLARRDELTGLLNRRVLGEQLECELTTAREHDRPLSLVMLDLDRFKNYNDAHGHQAGDRLLKTSAAAWVAELRSTDVIARYGGEEFIVILPNCTIDVAVIKADRLRAVVGNGATCSAGVATLDGSESGAQLIGRADHALYQAKERGRNCTSAAQMATDRT
jgi:diguanylate cyclase (GGDEF)-like protein